MRARGRCHLRPDPLHQLRGSPYTNAGAQSSAGRTQARRRRVRERAPLRSPFGRELAMLAAGMKIGAVLWSFLGSCSAGRAAERLWLEYLATIPTLRRRRAVLEHFLRTFNGAAKHGAQWRVVGAAGYVGDQHADVPPELVERVDPSSGEYTCEREHGYPSDPDRRHCPSASAGGIAAHSDKSPHTLNAYRRHMREGGIMASTQPPYDAPDAVRPRHADGTWAYAQHWLKVPPTPEMLARWRGRTAPPGWLPPELGDTCGAPRADDLGALQERVDRELSGPRDFRESIY